MKRWELIFNIAFTVVGFGGSLATLWAFFHGTDYSVAYWALCAFAVAIAVFYIIVQVAVFRREAQAAKKVYMHSSPAEVHKYLYGWLKSSGRTVIFTRDFSWAHATDEMWTLLESKARNDNLIICLKKETPDTNALKDAGAMIYVHDIDNLQSRFIIAHYKTHSPRITVGSRINGSYVNEQYDMQSSPNACNVFVELFESTKAAAQQKVPQK